MSSAIPGCTFSAWQATGLIAVAQPGQLSVSAFADSNGTLTVLFSRNIVLVLLTTTLALIVDGSVTAVAVVVGVLRTWHPRSRTPRSDRKRF